MATPAQLAGYPVSDVRLLRVRVGVWVAQVELPSPAQLAGAVSLTVGDLTLAGTIVRGGPVEGEASYLVTGGAGKWRQSAAARAYRNDLGVKASTVLKDVARDAGEQINITSPEVILGSAWVRAQAPAWNVLAELAPVWWVDVAGVTQVGPRPATAVSPSAYRLIRWVRRSGLQAVATDTPSLLEPGFLLGGAPIEEVLLHANNAGLRCRVRAS
jgi:hypothetical protein